MLTRLGELPEGYKFSEGLLTTLGSILSGQQDAAEEQEQADDGVPLTSAVSTAADAALGAALRALGPDVVLQVSWLMINIKLVLVGRARVKRDAGRKRSAKDGGYMRDSVEGIRDAGASERRCA